MADDHKTKMQPRADAPPGLETDGQGNVIPFAQRTKEDQDKASGSVKNPQQEAQHPAPMPKDQQGQGSAPKPNDPAGHQGDTHR